MSAYRISYLTHTYLPAKDGYSEQGDIHFDQNVLAPPTDEQYYENFFVAIADETGSNNIRRFDLGISVTPRGKTITHTLSNVIMFKYLMEGTLNVDGTRLRAGEMIFFGPYTVQNWVWESDARLCWCAWRGEIVNHVAAALHGFEPGKPYYLGLNDLIEPLFGAAVYNRHYPIIDAERYFSGFTDQLLALLTAHKRQRDGRELSPLVKKALARIDKEYAVLNVDALATSLFVDAAYLSRAFRRELDTTPKAVITRTRMTYAEYYLNNSEKPIQRIAELVGYSNYTNFYTAFRAQFGVSPEAYRRTHGEKKES